MGSGTLPDPSHHRGQKLIETVGAMGDFCPVPPDRLVLNSESYPPNWLILGPVFCQDLARC